MGALCGASEGIRHKEEGRRKKEKGKRKKGKGRREKGEGKREKEKGGKGVGLVDYEGQVIFHDICFNMYDIGACTDISQDYLINAGSDR